jgi:hypothetical protein
VGRFSHEPKNNATPVVAHDSVQLQRATLVTDTRFSRVKVHRPRPACVSFRPRHAKCWHHQMPMDSMKAIAGHRRVDIRARSLVMALGLSVAVAGTDARLSRAQSDTPQGLPPGVSVTISPVFEGRARLPGWGSVSVDLVNDGDNDHSFEFALSGYGGSTTSNLFVDAPRGARKRFPMTFFVPSSTNRVIVQVIRGGALQLRHESPVAVLPQRRTVVIASGAAGGQMTGGSALAPDSSAVAEQSPSRPDVGPVPRTCCHPSFAGRFSS